MEKKPKLLNKKKIVISCKSMVNTKIIEQGLKNIEDYESVNENELNLFLSRIFMYEPKLLIIAHDSMSENLNFSKHVRNNPKFSDIPIICISEPSGENIFTKKQIANLKINYFKIPVNPTELSKSILIALE